MILLQSFLPSDHLLVLPVSKICLEVKDKEYIIVVKTVQPHEAQNREQRGREDLEEQTKISCMWGFLLRVRGHTRTVYRDVSSLEMIKQ